MLHLYHFHHKRPGDLARVTLGLTWCSKQVIREGITNDVEAVTCDACKNKWINWKKEGEIDMDDKTDVATSQASGPQMVAEYNALAMQRGLPTVKKFKTLEVAKRRLEAIKNGPAKEKTKTEAAPKTKKIVVKKTRRGLDETVAITILEPAAFDDKKHETEAMKRFKKMVKTKSQTVGDYLKIADATIGDLNWWAKKYKYIKLG